MLTTLLRYGGGTAGISPPPSGGGTIFSSPVVTGGRSMANYKPGDTIWEGFPTHTTAGVASNADSLPTATLRRNGTTDGTVTLTVANAGTGQYTVTGTIPSGYAAGDKVQVDVSATVGGTAGKAVLTLGVLDSRRLADLVGTAGYIDANVMAFADVGVDFDGTPAAVGATTLTLSSADPRAPFVQPGTPITIPKGTGSGGTVYTLTSKVSGNQWNVTPAWAAGTPDTTTSRYSYEVDLASVAAVGGASLGDHVGANFETFWQNAGANTAKVVDNVGSGSAPTAAQVATAVWQDATAGDFTVTGSAGAKLTAAGSAGDPWATALPGAYAAGTAGAIVGGNLDQPVGTRLAASGYTAPLNSSQVAAAVWDAAQASHVGAGTFGLFLDAAVSSRSTLAAAGVWDQAVSGHTAAGTFGAAMNAAGSAGDPWATPIPGAYAAGTAGNLLGSNLDAKVSTRSTYAGGAVASVTAPVTVGANNDKSGYALSAAGLDSIAVEAGVNARQALSPILAAAAGQLSGAGTGSITIKAGNDAATTRITAQTDGAGNRTTVTLALPS